MSIIYCHTNPHLWFCLIYDTNITQSSYDPQFSANGERIFEHWKITQKLLKMSHLNFWIWHFPPIFVFLKLTCLVTLLDRKLQVFKNSPNWTIFGIFNQLLSTQNVNVARYARNVECDFFCNFQTPCIKYEIRHLGLIFNFEFTAILNRLKLQGVRCGC